MKKCPYCGKDYPDDAVICAVDQAQLVSFVPPPLTSVDSKSQSSTKQSVGCLIYAIGGASFIPLIGVLFGIIAIVLGIVKKVRALILLGVCGILFSVILYGALFYLGYYQRGGIYDKMRASMALTMLTSAVQEIEYYKLQHGR